MTSRDRFRELVLQHGGHLHRIEKEWRRADETMLEHQRAGMGRETSGYEKIAIHERGSARRLVADYHDKVVMLLLPHVDELLRRELIAYADRLHEDLKDPRRSWSTRYGERGSKLDRLLGARVQADDIVARDQAQQPTQQIVVPDPAVLPQPHVGDDLLRYLADQPDEMAAVIELPGRFRAPDLLTVCDADGLIEFGTRNHCHVGHGELCVEKGWNFASITGPNRKPMKQFIAETLGFSGDERIRPHVRVTAEGRVRAARLAVDRPARQTEQKPNANETDWRDVQRRLLELYVRGEAFPTYRDLAKALECSVATIRKAIKPPQAALDRLDEADRNEAISIAHKLAGWQARHSKRRGSPRASSLTERMMDNAEQTRELDPAEGAETDDADVVFARLLQEAKPDERAKLNVMTSEQRRELVALLRDDPDRYDRLLG